MTAIKIGTAKTDFVANARQGWGEALPDWILVLAEAANGSSGAAIAKKLGYSGAVITEVIYGKYKGDICAVEAKVRGAMMGEEIACPVLGMIGRDQCLNEQKMKSVGSSSLRARIFRACRAGCEHSRIKNVEVADV
jgi:hypothetical protein